MPYKICTACRRVSYSAATGRLWFCPCCGQDLSQADALEDSRLILQLSHLRHSRAVRQGPKAQ